MTAFDPHKPETYPALLTVAEVAAILRTTPKALQQAVYRKRAAVMPFQRCPSMQWRRSQLVQHVEGDVAYLAHVTQRDPKATLRMSLRSRRANG
jgi:hypothetical protein